MFWVLEIAVPTRRFFKYSQHIFGGGLVYSHPICHSIWLGVVFPGCSERRCVTTPSDNDMDPRPRLYLDEH